MRHKKTEVERHFLSARLLSPISLASWLFCLLLLLLVLSPAWASASLYRGAESIGAVATVKGPSSGLWVSVEDVANLLGFSVSRSGEELQLIGGRTRLRLIMGASAAWSGFSLVPLHAVPFEEGGRCWMDAPSVVALFQGAVGQGVQNRLRFSGVAAGGAPPAQALAPAVQPAVQSSPAPVKQVADSPAPQAPAAPQTPAQPKVARQPAAGKNAQPQKKREVFQTRSGAPSVSYPSLNSGEVQRLRWSASNARIRAVADSSEGADPQVWMTADGVIHALFAVASGTLAAPYENVKVAAKEGASGVELTFTAQESVRVEKLVLDTPRRIVLDFFFPEGTRIRNAAAAPVTTPSAPAPQPVPVSSPQQPAAPVPSAPAQRPRTQRARKLVVVDPGHGGKDPGTAAHGVREKDVNLAIGLALEQELKAKGFDVLMTRRTDVYLKLQERTDIANNAQASLFVSVHVNALPSASHTSGFEIYIMALPTDKDALALAKIENREYLEEKGTNAEAVDRRTEMLLRILGDMQQNNKISESTGLAEVLFAAGKRNGLPMRRVAQAPFFVLRGAGMPAVLLETGFVTNATEAKLLAHQGYRQRIAQAMAAGIESYLK